MDPNSPHPPPIVVLCAIEEELVHLRNALPAGREEWRTDRPFHATELDGYPLVLGLCGIGMASAAAVAECAIAAYRPAAMLNYGCTGAHREDLLPGDLVLGARTVAYDGVRTDADGAERYAGMRYMSRGDRRRAESLEAASHLLAAAQRAAAALEGLHEPWPPASGWPASVPHRAPRLLSGTVASADRWNRAHERIREIAGLHGSLCEDMEAAALAMTCASHDTPFLTIKDISNNELLLPTESGTSLVRTMGEQLGRRAAALMLATLRELLREPALLVQGPGTS